MYKKIPNQEKKEFDLLREIQYGDYQEKEVKVSVNKENSYYKWCNKKKAKETEFTFYNNDASIKGIVDSEKNKVNITKLATYILLKSGGDNKEDLVKEVKKLARNINKQLTNIMKKESEINSIISILGIKLDIRKKGSLSNLFNYLEYLIIEKRYDNLICEIEGVLNSIDISPLIKFLKLELNLKMSKGLRRKLIRINKEILQKREEIKTVVDYLDCLLDIESSRNEYGIFQMSFGDVDNQRKKKYEYYDDMYKCLVNEFNEFTLALYGEKLFEILKSFFLTLNLRKSQIEINKIEIEKEKEREKQNSIIRNLILEKLSPENNKKYFDIVEIYNEIHSEKYKDVPRADLILDKKLQKKNKELRGLQTEFYVKLKKFDESINNLSENDKFLKILLNILVGRYS